MNSKCECQEKSLFEQIRGFESNSKELFYILDDLLPKKQLKLFLQAKEYVVIKKKGFIKDFLEFKKPIRLFTVNIKNLKKEIGLVAKKEGIEAIIDYLKKKQFEIGLKLFSVNNYFFQEHYLEFWNSKQLKYNIF